MDQSKRTKVQTKIQKAIESKFFKVSPREHGDHISFFLRNEKPTVDSQMINYFLSKKNYGRLKVNATEVAQKNLSIPLVDDMVDKLSDCIMENNLDDYSFINPE